MARRIHLANTDHMDLVNWMLWALRRGATSAGARSVPVEDQAGGRNVEVLVPDAKRNPGLVIKDCWDPIGHGLCRCQMQNRIHDPLEALS